jgi:hypothetical protein
MILADGETPKNTLYFNITILPEAEFKTKGVSLSEVVVTNVIA